MTDSLEAWPFVVSRNRALDWRPVLAPEFLIDARADFALVAHTADPSVETPLPVIRQVDLTDVGPLTIAFRRSPAATDLAGDRGGDEPIEGDDGGGQLRDRFGRPVSVVEGVVLRGHQQVSIADVSPAIEAVRARTIEVYPDFWAEADESAGPRPTGPTHLAVASPGSGTADGASPRNLLIAGLAAIGAFLLARRLGGGRSTAAADRKPRRRRSERA